MANLIVKNIMTTSLKKLNESVDENGSKRYVFEGPFTICGVKNRNERIYDESEVLKHLSYLREKIKKEGCILGELDHPEGRFEIYLKDVSHKITDLWYVPEQKTVMGKLELLDTDNGKKMKAIVDAGCPLYVSSRAAGTVGSDSHVSIQQIFTYDIVATPGFEQCRLDAVSESIRSIVSDFINESKSAKKAVNNASKYGVLDENINIIETDLVPKIEESKNENIDMANLTQPLVNEDIQVKVSADKAKELGLSLDGGAEQTDGDENKPSLDDIIDITPLYAEQNKNEIEDIQPEFNSADENAQNSEGQTETNGENQVEDEQNPFMMESCNDGKKGKSKKEDVKTEYSEENDITECGDKDCDDKKCKNGKKVDECGDSIAEDLSKEKEAVKESSKRSMDYYNSVLEEHNIKMRIKQSIVNSFPFSISLSESNFPKFAQLSEQDKAICADYIFKHGIFDIQAINEQFLRPITEKMNSQKNYIRLADESDLDLYYNAPRELKESIDKMAEIYILENKSDVDEFWSRTGIRNFNKERVSNETFVQAYNEKMSVSEDEDSTYGNPFIDWVASRM